MEWASWQDFWAMGGYGLYVWGSYAVAFLAIGLEIFLVLRGRNETMRRLRRMRSWEEQ